MTSRVFWSLIGGCVLALSSLACSTEASGLGRAGAGGNGGESDNTGIGPVPPDDKPVVTLPPPISLVPDAGAVTGGGGPAIGTPEICNGIDDDGNGIIDDLDVNNDGVCDCIRIATLGKPGTWGKGDVFGAWLTARASDGAKDLGNQVITADLIRGFQIIVVQDVRKAALGRVFSADEVMALEDWVRGGGGLMTLIGFADASEINNVNLLLAPFGMNYLPQKVAVGLGTATVPITVFPAQHPITTNVKAVGANNGYPVAGQGTVYAKSGNISMGLAQEVDQGHVDLWGDEWITYNSEWTAHRNYQVELFWVNTIKWLTPVAVCQVAIPPALIL